MWVRFFLDLLAYLLEQICPDYENNGNSFVEMKIRIFHEDIPIAAVDMDLQEHLFKTCLEKTAGKGTEVSHYFKSSRVPVR